MAATRLDAHRERDLFLVFRIAKAFAKEIHTALACSLVQAAESIFHDILSRNGINGR